MATKMAVRVPVISAKEDMGERFSDRTREELGRRLVLFAKKEGSYDFEEKVKRIRDVFVILSGSDRMIGTKMAYAILNNGGARSFLESETLEDFLKNRINKVGKKTEAALKDIFDYCKGNYVPGA